MPEITDAEYRSFVSYQSLGTPSEVTRKISDLVSDNGKYRDQIRDMKEQLPPEGSFVIDEAAHTVLQGVQELGTLDEVKERLKQGDAAQQRAQMLEQRSHVEGFTKVAGLDAAAVETLMALPSLNGATFEVRTKKEDGQDVSVGYIKLPGEEKAMSFKDAQEKVPALKGLRTVSDDGTGPAFIEQGSPNDGKGPKETSIYDKIRAEAAAKKEAAQKDAVDRPKSMYERMGLAPSA